LHVNDRGAGVNGHPAGLGLQLVSQVVEQGLQGKFRLEPSPDGGTHAEVVFDADAHPDR
jgi:two-component sensor histidine kinase